MEKDGSKGREGQHGGLEQNDERYIRHARSAMGELPTTMPALERGRGKEKNNQRPSFRNSFDNAEKLTDRSGASTVHHSVPTSRLLERLTTTK
jgi:hypothetical protein